MRLSFHSVLMKFMPWHMQRKVRQRQLSVHPICVFNGPSVDTVAERVFDSVKEDNPMAVKMFCIVGTLA
jgi:hypothetical protein